MSNSFTNFVCFVLALQEAEHSLLGAPLNLSVKYRGDDSVYWGWSLPTGNYVTSSGLLDPGFGSGPIEFSGIEYLSVLSSPRGHPLSDEYTKKFERLCDAIRNLPEVSTGQGAITFAHAA